jgi:hypothetical protein
VVDGTTTVVLVGLAAGIGLIVIFGLKSYSPSIDAYTQGAN